MHGNHHVCLYSFTYVNQTENFFYQVTKTCLERNSYFESDLKMLKDQLNKACKRPNNQFEIKIVLDKETNANVCNLVNEAINFKKFF